MVRPRLLSLLGAIPALLAAPSEPVPPPENSSGGLLGPERAAYDVLHYDLSLTVDPERRRIEGRLAMSARWVAPSPVLVLDLDRRLEVTGVEDREGELEYERTADEIRIVPRAAGVPGAELWLRVDYGGEPRVAPRPPWDGGFTWSRTADGSPWIATSCQMQGADLWWPCKDHPSDEPESMDLHITVPEALVVASNGRLMSVEPAAEGRTFHWRVSTPVNNYGVALNIAPYETIEREYESTSGDTIDVTYWVLPENLERGRVLFEQILRHLRFFEELFGPYPFRADKYGVAETPHLGMEHQTIVAYGNRYRDNEWGFDWLHHHELAHEWFANLVTAADWKDFWLHEGFATYAQPLYTERLHGPEAYRKAMRSIRQLQNRSPVAPLEASTAAQVYFGDNDIYYKGAWILHTLRWLVGDEVFFRTLRRMAYPDPALEATTDGSACRFVTTDDFRRIAEEESGRELDWFFDAYVRHARLPKLVVEEGDGTLRLRWDAEGAFPMPIEVTVDGVARRVELPDGTATVPFSEGCEVDPDEWVLRAR